ncbi:MAG: TIGR03943 family protein [Cyanobacteria bacterium SW_9_44_58]|nr:MAG: TIGR03943 family protein [Cyanobacteria bacterium SW_9_44_58]
MHLIGKLSPYAWHSLILPSIDILTFLAWGTLLLKYWLSGQIKLLIHPNYIGLVVVTGFALLLLGFFKLFQLYQTQQKRVKSNPKIVQHVTLLPSGWSSLFLLGTALLGFLIPPTILSSETALQRGVRESLPLTQTQPEAFQVTVEPEQRSLIDWIKTLNAYPEPDTYQGQPVNVEGFVIKIDQLSGSYFLLAKFIITCCAIDAYPVALPVKLDKTNQTYPADTWLKIEGEMMTDTLPLQGIDYQADRSIRQSVIHAKKITKIPTPSNPYGY